jgi:hypothetical protein
MGESPPYKDKNITHGMCDICLKKVMKEIEVMHKKRTQT